MIVGVHTSACCDLQDEYVASGQPTGISVTTGKRLAMKSSYSVSLLLCTGEAIFPGEEGIWDNYRVKKTLLHSW